MANISNSIKYPTFLYNITLNRFNSILIHYKKEFYNILFSDSQWINYNQIILKEELQG
jgi:hypothetical protein